MNFENMQGERSPTQRNAKDRCHTLVPLSWMNSMVYELNLDKVVKKLKEKKLTCLCPSEYKTTQSQ